MAVLLHILIWVFLACPYAINAAPSKKLVGGQESTGTADDEVIKAAGKAIEIMNSGEFSDRLLKLNLVPPVQHVEITSATSQVVSGIKYSIIMTVQDSMKAVAELKVAVWGRPWLELSNDEAEKAKAWILDTIDVMEIEK